MRQLHAAPLARVGQRPDRVHDDHHAVPQLVGLGVEALVKTTTYVVGEDNIAAMRVVRRELSSPNPPTSTMVVVAALAVPGALVEVDAIASFAAKKVL